MRLRAVYTEKDDGTFDGVRMIAAFPERRTEISQNVFAARGDGKRYYRKETAEGRKKLIAMLVNKVIIYRSGKLQVVFNVLNDSQPIIRESWYQALDCAVHQRRITQVVEGAGLENR